MKPLRITIVNLHAGPADIVCDRTSPFGNPYKISSGTTRDEALFAFGNYLGHNPHLVTQLGDRIVECAVKHDKQVITLGCHCVPLRCHVGIMLPFVKEYLVRLGFDMAPE
jgi:hypothetical protein